jgi:hypothetical protein
MPKSAVYVDPVVICGTLQRLARKNRSALLLLSKAILFSGFVNEFPLHALFLSISVALLLVGDFRLLVKVLIRDFVRTKNALVCIGHTLFLVISACVAIPLVCLPGIFNTVARLVYSQATSSALQAQALR